MTSKEKLENLGYTCKWTSIKGWSKMIKENEIPIWVSRYGAIRIGYTLKKSISISIQNTATKEYLEHIRSERCKL